MTPSAAAWLRPGAQLMRAVHEEQLAEHGGTGGLKDEAQLDALMGPGALCQASGPSDVAAWAAACGCAVLVHRPFVSGNRGTAFLAITLCLVLNGWELEADDASCVLTLLAVDAGDLSQGDLAHWLRQHMVPRRACLAADLMDTAS